ncbi:MAG: DUF349 domain-containing protein [Thermodesulfobacteriota bacterium]
MIDFFFSRRKPRWRHANPEIRNQAIAEDDLDDQTLAIIAGEDTDPSVRLRALEAIDTPELLDGLATSIDDPDLAAKAAQLAASRRTAQVIDGNLPAGEKLALVERIGDDGLLQRIACEAGDASLRLRGAARVARPETLVAIGEQQCGKQVAALVIERIADPQLLERLAEHGGSRYIRRLAAAKLDGAAPPAERDIDGELQELVDNARRLSHDRNYGLVESRFAELQREWSELDPTGTSPLRAAFDEARQTFLDRRRQREEKEAARLSRERQQEQLRHTVEEILASIQKEPLDHDTLHAKEARILEICSQLEQEDSDRYHRRLRQGLILQQDYAAFIAKEQPLFDTMLGEAAELPARAEDDPRGAAAAVRRIRRQLAKNPFQTMDASLIERHLDQADDRIREQRRLADEARRRNLDETVGAIDALTGDLRRLIAMEDKGAAAEQFRELQERYEALDLFDDPRINESLGRCKEARRQFLAGQREFFSEQDWLFWSSRTIKEDLVAEVAALAENVHCETILATVKSAQRRWKESGHTPNAGRLWHEFHNLCQQQYGRCLPYLEAKKVRRADLLIEKEQVVARAETVAQAEHFKDASREMTALGERMREMGPLGGKEDRELTARYHRAANQFFERRRVHFAAVDRQRMDNLAKKELLCQQMEQLTESPGPETGRQVAALQKRWKTIGPAPQEHNDAIWQRFQQAADRYYRFLDSQRQESLAAKEALIAEAAAVAALADEAEDLRELTEKIKGLQARWKESGQIAKEGEESLWREFRGHCDRFFGIKEERYNRLRGELLVHQRAKEEIIEQLEALAPRIDDKEATETVKELQQRYGQIGPAPREVEKILRDRFQRLCNGFFEGRQKHFSAIKEENDALLKEKEALIFELEKLAGMPGGGGTSSSPKTLTLAEQLKLAIESNTLIGSGDRESARRDEARRIGKRWSTLPPLPWRLEDRLQQRFQRAMDTLKQQDQKKQSR